MLHSVAMVMTDVFQINWFSVRNKIDKIAKIFGQIEDPENRGVIWGAETFSALVPELLMISWLTWLVWVNWNNSEARALDVSAP